MTRILVGGLWNAQRDRSPRKVRRYLARMVRRHDLDFVLLQEFADYVGHLHRHPIEGYRLLCPSRLPGTTQNPILVRASVGVRRARVIQMSRAGWQTVEGKPHAPVFSVAARLDGWLRVVSIHAPVSVSWPGGEPSGPPERVTAYLDHTDRAAIYAKLNDPGALHTLLGGDWNARIWERGTGTPADLADRAGLTSVVPPSVGPGHDGIDYVLTDARVGAMRRYRTGGGDHPFIVFTVWAA